MLRLLPFPVGIWDRVLGKQDSITEFLILHKHFVAGPHSYVPILYCRFGNLSTFLQSGLQLFRDANTHSPQPKFPLERLRLQQPEHIQFGLVKLRLAVPSLCKNPSAAFGLSLPAAVCPFHKAHSISFW